MPVRVTSLGFILQQQLFPPFWFSKGFLFLVLLFDKTSVLSHCVMQCILPLDKNKVRREAGKGGEVDASRSAWSMYTFGLVYKPPSSDLPVP